MTPLRIHFFVGFVHPQGTYFRFHNLARGLRALGHIVEVYAADEESRGVSRTEVRDGVSYHITPTSRGARLFSAGSDPVTAQRRAWAGSGECDIAHLFQPFLSSALPWRWARARAWVYDWDDLWIRGDRPRALRPLKRHWIEGVTGALERGLPGWADHVTAIDHFLADLARARGARETSILYNPSPLYQIADRRTTRAAFGLDPDGLYAGFMGYTTAELDWCLEGIARNITRFPRLRFVLCGPTAETLSGVPSEVAGRVDCLGRLTQPQARAVAGAMDLALLPMEDNRFNQSRFPVKFSEYLMAGTPTLCSEVGECALIAGRIPGVVRAGRTRAEWLDAFDHALRQAAARTLTAVDRDAVHARFDSGIVCRGLAETYESVLAAKRLARRGEKASAPGTRDQGRHHLPGGPDCVRQDTELETGRAAHE